MRRDGVRQGHALRLNTQLKHQNIWTDLYRRGQTGKKTMRTLTLKGQQRNSVPTESVRRRWSLSTEASWPLVICSDLYFRRMAQWRACRLASAAANARVCVCACTRKRTVWGLGNSCVGGSRTVGELKKKKEKAVESFESSLQWSAQRGLEVSTGRVTVQFVFSCRSMEEAGSERLRRLQVSAGVSPDWKCVGSGSCKALWVQKIFFFLAFVFLSSRLSPGCNQIWCLRELAGTVLVR